VGKSRLIWEVIRSQQERGWHILESRSVSYGKANAYQPVIDLLKPYFRVDPTSAERSVRDSIAERLLALDPALEPTLPAFLALMDIPVEDPAWTALEPAERRQHTLEAIKRVLLRESQVQPLCVVFEDLQWIDTETQSLLDILVDSLPKARILLLVDYRPEYQHAWSGKTYYTQLRLDPLPPENVDELLRALLGGGTDLGALKELLTSRCDGNPFFLEETVRTLIETQVLLGERGAYRLGKPIESIEVPATVQAVLAARIDRLPAEEKRLLQSASVIGTDVPFPLLRAIADAPEDMLRRNLAELQAAEFLYERTLFPEAEYTFRHALTHQVAYGSVLHERRKALHAGVVEAIERLYPDRLMEQVERLARHAPLGAVWDKALPYLRQAGAKAAARSAHQEAVAYLERALEALEHLPKSRESVEHAVDVRFELRNSLFPLGDHARILYRLRQAEKIAESLADEGRVGWAACYLSHCARMMGDHRGAVESGQRALACAAGVQDAALELETNCYLGQAYYLLGRYGEAITHLETSLGALGERARGERFGLPTLPAVFIRTWLAWCLAECGDFLAGIARADEAVTIAQAADHPYSVGVALYGRGGVYLRQGDLAMAVTVLERSLRIGQTGKLPVLFVVAAIHLGHAYACAGRLTEAISLLEEAVERAGPLRLSAWRSLGIAWLGEAYALAGRSADGRERLEQALELFRQRGERGYEAWGLRALGDVYLRGDRAERPHAEVLYRQAIAVAEELGMQPLSARCRIHLAVLYAERHDHPTARAELSASVAAFHRMGMTSWLARAEAELARLP
jgi:tetratricopeptide (TPR) repeat protein